MKTKTLLNLLFITNITIVPMSLQAQVTPSPRMITVKGGTMPPASSFSRQTVKGFLIGKYEVTKTEWDAVRNWAVANGYRDLANRGMAWGSNHPIQQISWLDALKWCNALSQKAGLTPVYMLNGAPYKIGHGIPTVNALANGYRLPTDIEWEWAARGGIASRGYIYSGSNDLNSVAWNKTNSFGSGGTTSVVGTKAGNELGIFDMSGNVFEWCWDLHDPKYYFRRLRGGSWVCDAADCAVANRLIDGGPASTDWNVGFRLARNSN